MHLCISTSETSLCYYPKLEMVNWEDAQCSMYLNVLPSSMFAGNVIKDDWYIFYIVVYLTSL